MKLILLIFAVVFFCFALVALVAAFLLAGVPLCAAVLFTALGVLIMIYREK